MLLDCPFKDRQPLCELNDGNNYGECTYVSSTNTNVTCSCQFCSTSRRLSSSSSSSSLLSYDERELGIASRVGSVAFQIQSITEFAVGNYNTIITIITIITITIIITIIIIRYLCIKYGFGTDILITRYLQNSYR